jgi:ActR/RegA family two-component response regulator
MPTQPRVLFLDDEESIRVTLPPMLESYGFKVTSAGTVPDALRLISHEKFDVLIADLNVGNAGDGFTVVSAMRRTQPQAVSFILTGYPAFETALEAIRQQVDDYLTKPTEIESLVDAINSKLANRKPTHGIQPKRLPDIMEQHRDWIVKHWLVEVKKDPEIGAISLSDSERQDHVPRLLQEALERTKGRQLTPEDTQAAALHGILRRKQGYTAPLVIREAKLLLGALAQCVQQNLLAIQVSYLIPDMVKIWETIETELEISVKALLDDSGIEEEQSVAVPQRVRQSPRSRDN